MPTSFIQFIVRSN